MRFLHNHLPTRTLLSLPTVALAVLLGSLIGAIPAALAVAYELPLFLDTLGTMVVAVLYGGVPGFLTGVLTNLFAELLLGGSVPLHAFAPVNGAVGYLVGTLAWRFDLRRPGVLLALLLSVSLVSTILGSATVVLAYSGVSATSVDYLVAALAVTGRTLASSAVIARLPLNIIDKLLSVIASYVAYIAIRKVDTV